MDNTLPDPNNAAVTFDYTLDNVGNRLSMTVDAADQHDYTYDDTYQLTDVDYPAGAGTDTAYAYDKVHNRTSTDAGDVVSYTANDLNQYTAVGAANLYYDNNGNLTDDGTPDYEYHIFNRLIIQIWAARLLVALTGWCWKFQAQQSRSGCLLFYMNRQNILRRVTSETTLNESIAR